MEEDANEPEEKPGNEFADYFMPLFRYFSICGAVMGCLLLIREIIGEGKFPSLVATSRLVLGSAVGMAVMGAAIGGIIFLIARMGNRQSTDS